MMYLVPPKLPRTYYVASGTRDSKGSGQRGVYGSSLPHQPVPSFSIPPPPPPPSLPPREVCRVAGNSAGWRGLVGLCRRRNLDFWGRTLCEEKSA